MQVMSQASRTETGSRRPQMSPASAPSLALDSPVDRVSAIDFINRVNWLFDAWDIDAMVEAFLPGSVTHHTHGVVAAGSRHGASSKSRFPTPCPGLVGTPSTRSLIPTTMV